jgi:hypothetical protein
MLTAVVIDVPTDLAPAVAQIVVNRCESAIGNGRCPLAADVGESVVIRWHAVVRAEDGAPARLQIDFRGPSASGPLLAQRTLFFSERDAVESRWASVALVIAALVTEAEAVEAAPVLSPPKVPTEQPTSLPLPSMPYGFDIGFVTGPGLQHGGYRFGAFARGWIGVSAAPGIVAVLGVRYAERSGDASLTWLTSSLGAGVRVGSRGAPINGEMIGSLLVERMLVTAFDPSSGQSDSGGATRFGGSLGVDLAATLWKELRIVVGGEVSALTPPVNIEVKGASVGREPGLRFALTGGLRLGL